MGTLVAMRYPTAAFANLADHTYVQCGTGGKAWGCWGGKSGGSVLRQGSGSTNRADAIAEPDERAGITCYLINGVCHQAANRILLPARTTVRGARGYSVSESLYGPYGRPRGILGLCRAPFNQHPNVSGDLPECIGASAIRSAMGTEQTKSQEAEKSFLDKALNIYGMASEVQAGVISIRPLDDASFVEFQLQLFMLQADYLLSSRLGEKLANAIGEIRRTTEIKRIEIEKRFEENEISPADFVESIDGEIERFQHEMANVMEARLYEDYFGLKPGETITLSDPDIVKRAYDFE
ncbi:MAG: hypothetical protein KIT42_11910 [Rhodocyclaceae bacterium]|nr:hypothetical protein [Rhodocyclaceae bacterium]